MSFLNRVLHSSKQRLPHFNLKPISSLSIGAKRVTLGASAATLLFAANMSSCSSEPSSDTKEVPSDFDTVHSPKPRVLFVLGGPGAGKGTQCSMLVDEYGFVHLSAGDLLREARDSGSKEGELIERYITAGQIVPQEITVRLLKYAMIRSGSTKFLIDGFPRNFNNLEGWQSGVGDSVVVDGVLFYEVDEDTLVKRLVKRSETSGRSDDNIDTIVKRLRTYNDSTVPVVKHYDALNQVTRIFGGDAIPTVFERSKHAVAKTISEEVLSYDALLSKSLSSNDFDAFNKLTSSSFKALFAPENAEKKTVFEELKKDFERRNGSKKTTTEFTPLTGRLGLVSSSTLGENGVENKNIRVWKLEGNKWRLLHTE